MKKSSATTNLRVLVVDDDPIVAKALASLLRKVGYDAVVFTRGAQALEYLRDNGLQAALIDIHLPDISGLDLSQEIRRIHGETVPIIILSGDTDIETLRALPNAGATYFFSKPVNTTHLLDHLKACTTPA